MARFPLSILCAVSSAVMFATPVAVQADACKVKWRDDYNSARSEAKRTGRPLMVTFANAGCLICQKMDLVTFGDARVVKLLNQCFIPLRINGRMEGADSIIRNLGISAYPAVVLASADGTILQKLEGFQEPAAFRETLQRALDERKAPVVQMPVPPSNFSRGAAPAYRVYRLSEVSDNPELGMWLSITLPQMIQPQTWEQKGGTGTLSYYAPGKILVVYHTAAVQTEVAAFLKDIKQALPKQALPKQSLPKQAAKETSEPPFLSVYSLPNGQQVSGPAAGVPSISIPSKSAVEPAGHTEKSDMGPGQKFHYPVPGTKKQPKHLFHFIIRYEGEGVIDSSVVALFKAIYGDGTKQAPTLPAVAPAPTAVLTNGSNPPSLAPVPTAESGPPAAKTGPPALKK